MKLYFTSRARKEYIALSDKLQKISDKQMDYLLENLLHPSLHAKKYNEQLNYWQARVNRDYRFYFQIDDDAYLIISIKKHPKN